MVKQSEGSSERVSIDTSRKIIAHIAAPRMRTIKETAKATGVAEHRIRILCKTQQIAAIECGRRWLVNLDRFIDYLNDPNGTTRS